MSSLLPQFSLYAVEVEIAKALGVGSIRMDDITDCKFYTIGF